MKITLPFPGLGRLIKKEFIKLPFSKDSFNIPGNNPVFFSGISLARRETSSVYEAVPRERRHHRRDLLRRHRRNPDVLQGRRQPRRGFRPAERDRGASVPHSLQHSGQNRDVPRGDEERVCFNTGKQPGHNVIQFSD
jgi:hypothetical protein